MFTELDSILFPDCCEVLEITPSQHYVFPIFKNGKTSLEVEMQRSKWKKLTNTEIEQIQMPITVFVRDPKQRFISGVNTYLQHLQRDCPELDTKTILWFVDQYLFLNRHYCPQFFWLMNLARYTSVPLEFKAMNGLSELTNIQHDANVLPPNLGLLTQLEQFNWKKLELYFYLDQLLVESIGKTFTFADILEQVKQHHEIYDLIFAKTTLIVNNVLSKT